MTLKTTPLHATHVELGAKMAGFGGWDMPIQYEGILAEHEAVRTGVGVFDVSHMGEVDFTGADALAGVAKLVTHDVSKLVPGKAQYTVSCQADGGIVDDCIVYQLGEQHFRIVINAANIDKDIAHFADVLSTFEGDCTMTDHSDAFALLAVQGPKAVAMVAELAGANLAEVPSFGLAHGTLAGTEVLAARTGYTGEDGFELFVPADKAVDAWTALTTAGAAPIGLGARDTLRLEARLSLYGNDIDATTNPYEAGLGWVVKLDKPHPFVGQEALRAVKAEGISRKLVGFKVTSRGIVRAGADVLGDGDAVVGHVTSGGVAPTVGGAIGLAYVPKSMASPGAPLRLSQRGRVIEAEQVKGPFYKRT
ncbi:MAG: glycine cleavage system aminomethyltransferase GcvT [Myxococcota bacterium]